MKHNIEPACLGFPPEEDMAEEDGLMENLAYVDWRGCDVETFRSLYEAEQVYAEALQEAGGNADTDELYNIRGIDLMCLDPGVASAVAALSVIGAAPITSCSAAEGHREDVPGVVFWCEERHLDLIVPTASEAGVSVQGIDYYESGPTGVMVYADSHAEIEKMRSFARLLVERWLSCNSIVGTGPASK